jgi:hypothetical protein
MPALAAAVAAGRGTWVLGVTLGALTGGAARPARPGVTDPGVVPETL